MDTLAVQKRLKELGIYPCTPDGRNGPMTNSAIRGFQRMHGLRVDGVVGPMTIAELWPAAIPARDEPQKEAPAPAGAHVWPRQRDVEKVFGPVGSNQVMLEAPYEMRLAWDKRQIVRRFSCHERVHDSLKRVLVAISNEYDAAARKLLGLDLFGGCLNVRKMRGGSAWSMHAWGIAIDLDPERNQLRWGKDRARFALPDCNRLHECFEAEGWTGLGRARNMDFQHFQAARL